MKILEEICSSERDITMTTHLINDLLKNVVEENRYKKGCSNGSWKIVDRFKKGLRTKFDLQCNVCGTIF